MKRLRWMMGLCTLALVGALAVPAAAQDQTFGLSAEDFALFSAAQTSITDDMAYTYISTFSVVQGSEQVMGWDVSGSGLFGPSGFSMINSGTISSGTQTQDAPLWLTVVGDSLYVSIDGEQWTGGTVEELTSQLGSALGPMMGMGMGGSGATTEDMTSQLMMQPGVMEAMMGLSSIDPESFISITRNEDFNNQASFSTVINLGDLASNEALAPLLGGFMGGAMGSGSTDMTDEQAAQMGAMVAGMLQNSTVTIDQFINIDTQMVESAQVTISLDIQGMATINLQLGVELASADGDVPEAPAEFAPFSESLGSLTGMMGG
jgi:hypothetical protein